MLAAASPPASMLPVAAEPSAPLGAPHLRGWHNEPCPCLNLPLPLPAASVLPAGLFFLSFFFFPFSFPLPASILEWFPAGAGTQPSLETSSWADLCKLPQMSVPGFSCHPRRVCGRDASSSAWQWAAACGRTRLSPDPCCPHRCLGYAGVAKT